MFSTSSITCCVFIVCLPLLSCQVVRSTFTVVCSLFPLEVFVCGLLWTCWIANNKSFFVSPRSPEFSTNCLVQCDTRRREISKSQTQLIINTLLCCLDHSLWHFHSGNDFLFLKCSYIWSQWAVLYTNVTRRLETFTSL